MDEKTQPQEDEYEITLSIGEAEISPDDEHTFTTRVAAIAIAQRMRREAEGKSGTVKVGGLVTSGRVFVRLWRHFDMVAKNGDRYRSSEQVVY